MLWVQSTTEYRWGLVSNNYNGIEKTNLLQQWCRRDQVCHDIGTEQTESIATGSPPKTGQLCDRSGKKYSL